MTILFPSTRITLIFTPLFINSPSVIASYFLPFIIIFPEGLKNVSVIPSHPSKSS